ncbi:hypothetical protein HOK68_02310 [Candidatus Woesearchaeota archaeon]|jgi:hypothetical protein|nr:hypothetical protein [Candidatus Woesearchaeota archaeon]MBT4387447.1 hypothetical protein [Candidatus Woesearchaeota archaeon]MBT4595824.1 hypothetical protein [Candidatus Woesearchaeota archaeon]MBT5741327.1 hypothetical protein [Candidatus Woesearchaeota archaeon]MBT6505587.1 hypothetical protein [Candidatus Woesearchaeota archaeon]
MQEIIQNSIRINILKKLMNYNYLTFTDLLGNEKSSLFNYHLKFLLDKDYIKKDEKRYELTDKGKDTCLFLDDNQLVKQPISVFLLIIHDNKKILRSRSLKEPFKEFWGASFFAKFKFGQSNKDIKNKIISRTGIKVNDYKFRGILNIKTIKNNNLIHHHILHIFETNSFKGELKSITDREHKWFDINDKECNIFPESKLISKEIFDHNNSFYYELERDFETGKINLIDNGN